MADNKDKETVEVPLEILTKMQEQAADMERKMADMEAKNAGLEVLFQQQQAADTTGEPKLRTKTTYEPKFRTVRIRKYPVAGNHEELGYVVGWTNRGAYQEVDKTGVAPQIVDYLDIVFLGKERNAEGKLQAEKVKLLDFMNKGQQVHCKILDKVSESQIVPTGEEIDVSIFDPAHGLVETGEKIDGFFTYSDVKYKVQIPGVPDPIWIDATYVNA